MAILIGDASPIVGFVAASQHQLLVDVLLQTYGRIEVPFHVDGEVSRKATGISRKARSNYDWMKSNGHVHVYQQAFAFGPGQHIAQFAADLLDLVPGSNVQQRAKDGGEAFAVAHAYYAQRAGTKADILMDDTTGRRWAAQNGVATVYTGWVFQQAKQRKLITNAVDMATAYNAVAKYTGALPPLANTTLLDGLP